MVAVFFFVCLFFSSSFHTVLPLQCLFFSQRCGGICSMVCDRQPTALLLRFFIICFMQGMTSSNPFFFLFFSSLLLLLCTDLVHPMRSWAHSIHTNIHLCRLPLTVVTCVFSSWFYFFFCEVQIRYPACAHLAVFIQDRYVYLFFLCCFYATFSKFLVYICWWICARVPVRKDAAISLFVWKGFITALSSTRLCCEPHSWTVPCVILTHTY